VRQMEDRIRELERQLGRKTMEAEILSGGQCPRWFSNRHGQELISQHLNLRAGLWGSLRGRRDGRRMFAFRVGWIEVVCAVVAAVLGAISPSPRVPAGRILSC